MQNVTGVKPDMQISIIIVLVVTAILGEKRSPINGSD